MIRRLPMLVVGTLVAMPVSVAAQAHVPGIEGVWSAERYVMKSGVEHDVAGHIFFTDGQWTVLFFVLDEEGTPRRGSGEGGSYSLDGDRLTLTHRYNLSAGDSMPSLPASPLRMIARTPAESPLEETTLRIEHDTLTLLFPSGNSMRFRKARGQ
jgi:hypothetical protein